MLKQSEMVGVEKMIFLVSNTRYKYNGMSRDVIQVSKMVDICERKYCERARCVGEWKVPNVRG